jgi:hypothetical protein
VRFGRYYKRFFEEGAKIGSGSFGTVFVCRHVLDGEVLGQARVALVNPHGLRRNHPRALHGPTPHSRASALVATASALVATASALVATASTLVATASALASALVATASALVF